MFKRNNEKLFDDVMEYFDYYYHNLHGERSAVHGETPEYIKDKMKKIIDDLHLDDDNQQCKDFTLLEPNNASKSFGNAKSMGVDFISCKALKIITTDY